MIRVTIEGETYGHVLESMRSFLDAGAQVAVEMSIEPELGGFLVPETGTPQPVLRDVSAAPVPEKKSRGRPRKAKAVDTPKAETPPPVDVGDDDDEEGERSTREDYEPNDDEVSARDEASADLVASLSKPTNPAPEAAPTRDELKTIGKAAIDHAGVNVVVAMLQQKFGTPKVADIPEARWGEVRAEFRKMVR